MTLSIMVLSPAAIFAVFTNLHMKIVTEIETVPGDRADYFRQFANKEVN